MYAQKHKLLVLHDLKVMEKARVIQLAITGISGQTSKLGHTFLTANKQVVMTLFLKAVWHEMIENLVLSFWLHYILAVPPLNGTTVRHFQI